MKFFKVDKIREADAYTIANEPIASINLMERAAEKLADWIGIKFNKEHCFQIFAGPGNNGGDAWALARLLWLNGYRNLIFYLLNANRILSPDSQINKKRLDKETDVPVINISEAGDFPMIEENDVVIDGLFGSGLSRPLDGIVADLIRHINVADKFALIAIDIPSGLFGEDNSANLVNSIIRADYTLTFQFPKLSFFYPENSNFIGDWIALDIGLHSEFIMNEYSPFNYLSLDDAVELLKIRKKFTHKGTYGHALLIAGSYGMMGAAILSARAAIRSGVGLLTVHTPRLGVEIMQTSVPEALLSIDESDIIFTEPTSLEKYSSVGVGPGINKKSNTKEALLALLNHVSVPIVIDADGLNILSEIDNWLEVLPKNSILTPHPKEFERLFGSFDDSYSRMLFQQKFSIDNKCVIILKGANSCVTTPDGEIWFNTTGNAGMATGGSGDVLTGIILGLLAQFYSVKEAALLGVYLHGLAGDLSAGCFGQHGLIASDIIDNIGRAFCVLEKKKCENEKI